MPAGLCLQPGREPESEEHYGARTTYAYDAANQPIYSQDAIGRTTYTFDAAGNQQQLPAGARQTNVYNADNRRTQMED